MMSPQTPPTSPAPQNAGKMPAATHANLAWTEFWRDVLRLDRILQERRAADEPAPLEAQTKNDGPI